MWMSPDGRTMNQIEHVMIQNKYRSTIADVQSYRRADCNTDHFMVIANCRLKLKSQINLRREKKPKFNLEFLKEDATRRKYVEVVNVNFSVKNEQNPRIWENIQNAI